ncbi:MAG TPA: ABC transporter ATP-binding protein [Methylomusa anaerophila]|uniref:Oligopeptide transport ATP-binding protein OppD n=1 Tax=Methylomusa anaerophila TaxID=1930071 RepID=A0A348AEF9_9FIRM|nr:ABC transporter ATP-binding protein [Methylomusa anaerophila]BBB89457.1 oligopeptide transport ATP-binding protein OppD [Methylomusa anaerophila]HML89689.1 ABC transporter ATP-binding protein [Methylomusa anaerophila]
MYSSSTLLNVNDLSVCYRTAARQVIAVNRLNLTVSPGEFVGVIGESGSGKSSLARAILRLLPANGKQTGGSIRFQDRRLEHLDDAAMTKVRGAHIGFVPQQPVAALNPVRSIASQLGEIFRLRLGVDSRQAYDMSYDILRQVKMGDIDRVLHAYSHELSGGMCQRVLLAMAVALSPFLLLADEPTTAVDARMRGELLDEITRQQKDRAMAVLLIAHDLPLVGRYADRLVVMYRGSLVETGAAHIIYSQPKHPYTRLLLGLDRDRKFFDIERLQDHSGCEFQPRCMYAQPSCRHEKPAWQGDEQVGWACILK